MSEAPASAAQVSPAATKLDRSLWWAVGGVLGWGLLIGWWLHSDIEPITGVGWGTYCFHIGINLLLGFLVALALRWRAFGTACLLVPLVLFFGLPAPSKAAAKLLVVNQTSEAVRVRISRADSPGRSATLGVPSGGQGIHRTAPGDYAETIQVEFALGEQRVTTTIAQLRTNQVAVTQAGLELVALRRDQR